MSTILVSRDGFVGNSPRYTGFSTPFYSKILQDDTGAVLDLTSVHTAFCSMLLVNESNPQITKGGTGTFTIPPATATSGIITYTYTLTDLNTPGFWLLFLSVQFPGEATPRVFDPDILEILLYP